MLFLGIWIGIFITIIVLIFGHNLAEMRGRV
jgi:hypothetical protein